VERGIERVAADAVLVDVGGGAGAVVVYAGDELLGRRLDLLDGAGAGPHVDVLERRLGVGAVASAVFASIACGEYDVTVGAPDGARRLATVRVEDGSVSELDLRGRGLPDPRGSA
jgi:hypothetical protein